MGRFYTIIVTVLVKTLGFIGKVLYNVYIQSKNQCIAKCVKCSYIPGLFLINLSLQFPDHYWLSVILCIGVCISKEDIIMTTQVSNFSF